MACSNTAARFAPDRPDLAALNELFCRLVLAALVKAERLSEGFRDRVFT